MSGLPTQTSTFDGPVPGVPGAVVREVSSLSPHLPDSVSIGPYTEVAPGALLFEVPRIARFLIRDGTTIDVEVAPDADRAAVALFLQGSARAALIHQRGELPLNATTLVAPNWRCVAICAPSAFGKSTLAAELCRRGWLLLADDITRISWNGTTAVAWPSHNRLMLWRESCEDLGMNPDELECVRSGMEKFFVPVPAMSTPASLFAAVRLRIGSAANAFFLPAAGRAAALSESTFHGRQIDPLGRRADHMRIVDHVARNCPVIGLDGARRAAIGELADRLADFIR